MKLTERILFLAKTIWNDLFGEEIQDSGIVRGDVTAVRLSGLLDEAQQHLDTLRMELAKALTRQKRIAGSWQEALAQAQSLDAAVDEALSSGQDEQARELLVQANAARADADELAELRRVSDQHIGEVRAAVNDQQERLDGLRRRALLLEDRESGLAARGELFGAQQSLTRQTDALQSELAGWEEKIARREDHLAARRDLLSKSGRG